MARSGVSGVGREGRECEEEGVAYRELKKVRGKREVGRKRRRDWSEGGAMGSGQSGESGQGWAQALRAFCSQDLN